MTGEAEAGILEDFVTAAVTYQTPDAYMIGTVLIGLLFAFIAAYKVYKKEYNDHLKKYSLTKKECPFGGDFLGGLVISTATGGFLGFIAPGILLGLMGQQEAPEMVYYFLAFLTGIVSGKYAGPFLKDYVDIIRDKLKISGDGGSAGDAADGGQENAKQ